MTNPDDIALEIVTRTHALEQRLADLALASPLAFADIADSTGTTTDDWDLYDTRAVFVAVMTFSDQSKTPEFRRNSPPGDAGIYHRREQLAKLAGAALRQYGKWRDPNDNPNAKAADCWDASRVAAAICALPDPVIYTSPELVASALRDLARVNRRTKPAPRKDA